MDLKGEPMARNVLQFIFILLILIMATSPSWAAPPDIKTLEIGETAPDFNLPGIDGKIYSLQDFEDSDLLVIIFTCNHCPTAQAYEDRINQLVHGYHDVGVVIVAVSPNDPQAVRLDELGYSDLSDSFEEMKIRAQDKGFKFPYLYDGENQKVSKAYGPMATPHVFIFDKERKLRYTGRIDDSEKEERVTTHDTRNAIEALLAGKPVPVVQTKTFGCSIKWADKRVSAKQALEQWNKEEASLNLIDAVGLRALIKNDSNNLLLINIWATWCGPCAAEFPELVTINRMYRQREFEMITISADAPENKDKVLAFLNKQHASFKNYLFQSENKYQLIEAVDKNWPGALPYTLLIAPGGKMLHRQMGRIDPLDMKKKIVGYLGRYYE
jgi:peroxiredoxin